MSDLETTRRELDDANSTIRQLLQQRKDLHKERDAAEEKGALSMRERAALAAEEAVTGTYEALDAAEAIRALPLLPDTAPDQPAWPVDGDDLGCGPMCHCGGPTSANPTNPDQVGPEEGFDAGWKAGVHHARAEHERRLTSLEKDYRDLADLVHGHSEDTGQAQAAIRGIGGAATSEDWIEFGKKLRRQDMGEEG